MAAWKGQVMVVTGAASGIGAGLVRYGARVGMHVIAVDVNEQGLDHLDTSVEISAYPVLTCKADVTDPVQVECLAEKIFDIHGKVNLLFNNAGIMRTGRTWECSLQDWHRTLDVNVMGVVHCLRSFVPRMLHQGTPGRVINTSSVGGLLSGGPFLGMYQGSKHLIAAITESLFQEFRLLEAPISASVLVPGTVATNIIDSNRHDINPATLPTPDPAHHDFRKSMASMIGGGMLPDEFAERCFTEIQANQFWIVPQPEFLPLYQTRSSSIVNRTNPITGISGTELVTAK